ncbi:Glutathione S-transferase [Plasmodiophora brassicae]|uniref:Glutathione S-transferase n=1 Tax=Plasmodiophora brassicae TaxID=37360 RepID=A0A0G4J4B5_PLABS|nr:hypothetical protein PBRA_009067 [Plasmodiophora brassicae]SPQ96968.1 unnamed protein product [Plasmodiophora brassicae]
MPSPSIKLTYFDMPGRAETIRLALHVAGVPYEFERVARDQWPSLKPKTPFGGLPVMTIDGVQYAQTHALLRYVAAIGKMEPATPIDRLKVDQIIEANTDIVTALMPSLREPDAQKKMAMRKELADTTLPPLLKGIDRALGQNATPGYTCGSTITIADISLWGLTQWFRSGMIDGIPKDLIDGYPAIAKVVQTVGEHPKVAEWVKQNPAQR